MNALASECRETTNRIVTVQKQSMSPTTLPVTTYDRRYPDNRRYNWLVKKNTVMYHTSEWTDRHEQNVSTVTGGGRI